MFGADKVCLFCGALESKVSVAVFEVFGVKTCACNFAEGLNGAPGNTIHVTCIGNDDGGDGTLRFKKRFDGALVELVSAVGLASLRFSANSKSQLLESSNDGWAGCGLGFRGKCAERVRCIVREDGEVAVPSRGSGEWDGGIGGDLVEWLRCWG